MNTPKGRLLLVYNPNAGQKLFEPNRTKVEAVFRKAGYEVTSWATKAAGDARKYIAQEAGDYQVVVCSGGDGTVNETIDALMTLETRPILGVIPGGTTNDFATSLGLPKDMIEAASVIAKGNPKPLDIGQFGKEYFSYVAAFGLFTDVSYATPQSKKNILGHLAYLLEGIKRLGAIQSYSCKIDLGTEQLEGDFIFGMFTSTRSVGGFKLPGELDIRMDDGLFEVCLLRKPANFFDLQNIIISLLNQEIHSESLSFHKASKVVVTAQKPLAWTLDGEFGGEFRTATLTNCYQAIQVLMPL